MVRLHPQPAMTTGAQPPAPSTGESPTATISRPRWNWLVLCALAVPGGVPGADIDHQAAQRLRDSGRILPLETIVQRAQALHPGKLLDLELEYEDGRYVYELELLDARGVVWELEYDAATAQLLRRKRED